MNPPSPALPAPPSEPVGARPPQAAVIFDMDGVVTDTATLHATAWKRLFDEELADPRLGDVPHRPFDPVEDYRRLVDGRSREDGVAAVLADRGIGRPLGAPRDGTGARSVRGLAARKNDIFRALLAEQGPRVFPGTVALLRRLKAGGVPVGLVTASRNLRQVLVGAGLVFGPRARAGLRKRDVRPRRRSSRCLGGHSRHRRPPRRSRPNGKVAHR